MNFTQLGQTHLEVNNQCGNKDTGALNKITDHMDVRRPDVYVSLFLIAMSLGGFSMAVPVPVPVTVTTAVTVPMLMKGQTHSATTTRHR